MFFSFSISLVASIRVLVVDEGHLLWGELDTELALRHRDGLLGLLHIIIEFWLLVVEGSQGWLAWDGEVTISLAWAELPLPGLTGELLSLLQGALGVENLLILAEVWHKVVHWVALRSWRMQVLSETGR